MPESAIDFQPEQIDFQPEDSSPPPVTLNTRRGGFSGEIPPVEPSLSDTLSSFAYLRRMGATPGAVSEAEKRGMTPYAGVGQVARGVKHLVEAPLPAPTGFPERGVSPTASVLNTARRGGPAESFALPISEEQARAGSEIIGGGVKATLPLMGAAALEAPVSTAAQLGAGYVASKGVEKGAEAVGVSQPKAELLGNLAYAVPYSHALTEGIAPRFAADVAPGGTRVAGEVFGGKVRGAAAVTPEEVVLRGGVGSKTGEVRIPRGKKPAGPAIEPPTIEGEFTRAEIAEAQAATNYAGPEQAKAAALAKRAAEQPSQVAPQPVVTPSAAAAPAGAVSASPAPAPQVSKAPQKIDFQPEPVTARASGENVGRPGAAPPTSQPAPVESKKASQEASGTTIPERQAQEPTPTVEPVKTAEQPYKYGSTQANIPDDSEAAKGLESARQGISEGDLAAKGKDVGGNHLTVRYGIKGDDVEGVRAYLRSLEPFEATLGKTDKFEPTEQSDGAAVIHAPIEAPELHQINQELAKHGEFTEPTFDYQPHATVAYVKPEVADRYVGMNATAGKKFTVRSIAITDQTGKQEEVPLEGKGLEVDFQAEDTSRTGNDELVRQMDELTARGAARREASQDPSIRALRPTDTDWMTPEELEEFHQVQQKWMAATRAERSRESAAARVAEKRAERQKLGLPPEPGQTGEMKVSDLKIAPSKFQYKLATDAEGVSQLLKGVRVFNPDLAGQISVWRDPEDGKTYVVNGHHRVELAKRLGEKALTVRHVKAPTAVAARAIGAMQNIADGRGTAIDAAKFLRDTGTTAGDFEKKGISLGEATAANAVALSKLDTLIFNKVVSGDLRQGRAIAIGESTSDPAEQKAILSLVEKRERGGGKVSDDTLSELIRLVKSSEQTTETTADLFGSQEIGRSLAIEKAEISSHVKQQLAKDKKLFGFVAKEGRAQELSRGGNVIDVAKSKDISSGAAQAEEVYNKLSERGGPISSILDESARRLADGENAANVKSEAYQRVRAEVSKTLSGGEERGAGRSEGTPESQAVEGKPTGKPEGSIDLFHPEAATPLITGRSPQAEAKIASRMQFHVEPAQGTVPRRLVVNREAIQMIAKGVGRAVGGVNLAPEHVPELQARLEEIASNMPDTPAAQIRSLSEAIGKANDPRDGVIVIPSGKNAGEIVTVHEELYHAAVQRRPGEGNIGTGVPWQKLADDPGISRMSERLKWETFSTHPAARVAEGMADIAIGTAPELNPEEALQTALRYYVAVSDAHGIESVQAAQDLYDFIDRLAVENGIIPEGEQFNADATAPGRQAVARVLALRSGKGFARSSEAIQAGAVVPQPASGAETGALAAQPDRGLRPSGERSERVAQNSPASLGSTAPVGLTDDELESWSKARTFRVEPAGEQLDMFGGGDKIFRVFRGKESGLVYENQLDRLGIPTDPEAWKPPAEQTSLFRGESGSLEPGKLSDAARTMAEYLHGENAKIASSRELQSGMYDLESQYQADVLRAVHTMQTVNKHLGRKAIPDYEAIYHHLENPEGVQLSPSQQTTLRDIINPLMDESDHIYQKLTDGGVPVENYVHRVVKDKGSWFDRILAGSKGTGRGNLLSKSAPQTKGRTMMALELDRPAPQGSLLDKPGDRVVVSLKGGQVTAWRNGEPENLGSIMHSDEGRVFEDKEGNIWTLKQATTKEIEADTDLEYHHNALASALVSFLQLRKAERGFDFIESFKDNPNFKQIAVEQGKGSPPNGWQQTDLPQLRGYYFEPHTAEVLDWYSGRLKQGAPNVFDKISQFLRTVMLINPLVHPLNVGGSWVMEKGVTGLLPHRWVVLKDTGLKAVRAVLTQNDDFLAAQDAGAPLESARQTTQNLSKLFFETLTGGLNRNEGWATRLAKTVGQSPQALASLIQKPASQAAWLANDIFFLQSAYEKTAAGAPLRDALKETGRFIPDYRLPTRIFDSHSIGKLLGNRYVTMFSSYHYGLLKGFAEMGKSMVGKGGIGEAETPTGNAWGMFLAAGLIAFALYPLVVDELAKRLTGDDKAKVRRFGPFGVIEGLRLLAAKERTPVQEAESLVTPNPATKGLVSLATNRELETGHQIYDANAPADVIAHQLGRFLVDSISPAGQIAQASERPEGWKKYSYSWLNVTFPRSGAEKVAQNISATKGPTKAWTDAERTKYYAEQTALEALRKGDSTPLLQARMNHILSADETHQLQRRAKLSWLQDKVHNFSYAEIMEVYNAPGATEQQKRELEPIIRRKRDNLLTKHRGAEVEQVEANQ